MKHHQRRLRIGAALLTLCILLCTVPQPLGAQSAEDLSVSQIDTSGYPTVDVYVGSRTGRFSSTTPPPTVTVEELAGGKSEMHTVTGELQQRGVSVIVLVDLHRRMRGLGMPGMSRLDTAREAIRRLIDELHKIGSPNQLGILGYHRDVIEVMPLQPLQSSDAKNYVNLGAPANRLFDILPKGARTPANDPSDPHAMSALSQAVVAAAATLNARSLPGQRQVILIIGNTCDDLRPELTDRNDLNCVTPKDTQEQLNQYKVTGQLSIFGVGVGSDDPRQPLVSPENVEYGFNYTSNFTQIRELAGTSPSQSFFVLHTSDAATAQATWDTFTNQIAAPIANQGVQLKVTFQSNPDLSDGSSRTARLTIGDTQIISLPFDIQNRSLDLFVNGTTIFTSSVTLQPGQYNISASAQLGAVPITQAVSIIVPTPTPNPDQSQNDFLWWPIIVLLVILGCVALLYFFVSRRTNRPKTAPSELDPIPEAETQRVEYPLGAKLRKPYELRSIRGVDKEAPSSYEIESSPILIGSDKNEMDLYINDPSISPRHAELSKEKDQLFVTDRGSHNGTFVNQERLKKDERRALNPGDILTLGETVLALQLTRSGTRRLSDQPDQTSAPAEINTQA
jgi:hypothetical protein